MPNTYYQSDKIYGLNASDQLFGVVTAAGGGGGGCANTSSANSQPAAGMNPSLTGLAALANQNVLAQAAALAAQQQAALGAPTQAQLIQNQHNFQIAGQAQLAQMHQMHLQQQQQSQAAGSNSSAAMLAAALTHSSSSSASSSPSAQPFLNGLSANGQQTANVVANTSTSASPTSLSSSSSSSSNQNLTNGAQLYHQTGQSNTTPTNLGGSDKGESVRLRSLFCFIHFIKWRSK
jgi:hypothetical protein